MQDQVGDFILGAGSDTGVLWGAFSRSSSRLAGIGTAVALFPVVKRQNETAALGFVTSRILEAAIIFVGVVSLLSVVTLRQDVAGTAGADAASLVTTGHALVATYNWTFLLSQSLMPVFNALLPGHLLYRSGLVPRILPIIGLVGAPLLLAAVVAVFFGVFDRTAPGRRSRRAPGRRVGVLARRLPDRQGLQALADPRRPSPRSTGPRTGPCVRATPPPDRRRTS